MLVWQISIGVKSGPSPFRLANSVRNGLMSLTGNPKPTLKPDQLVPITDHHDETIQLSGYLCLPLTYKNVVRFQ